MDPSVPAAVSVIEVRNGRMVRQKENSEADSAAELHKSRFRAIGDENRFHILRLLWTRPYAFSELLEILNLEQSHLSHHLKNLLDAKLVCVTREGRSRTYDLYPGIRVSRPHSDMRLNLGLCEVKILDP